MENEETGMKLRSKVNWFTLGGRNTKFFNIANNIRKSKNSTLRLLNEKKDNLE